MAKGKSGSGKTYISKGVHSNVSRGTLHAMNAFRKARGDRVINQLNAFRAGKRVMITIPNPDHADAEKTGRQFIRVEAKTVWKNQSGEGYDPTKAQDSKKKVAE